MIDKIACLINRWFNTTHKDTYTKWLEQFDLPSTGMSELPMMLVEFWRRLNTDHFITGPSVREQMSTHLELRHKTIGDLAITITYATNALIHDDEQIVMEVAKDKFIIKSTLTLDDYLMNGLGSSLSYHATVELLKNTMAYHYTYLENTPSNYHSRVLNRMYNDILSVTRLLIANMPEGKIR